jgi:acyl-CoA thioesterase
MIPPGAGPRHRLRASSRCAIAMEERVQHPFAELIGLEVDEERRAGYSKCTVQIDPERHLNPHRVAHGAVLYALADTGMGAALYPTLEAGEHCATVEIKMNYFRPVTAGTVVCIAELVNRGRTVANLDARLYVGERLVAQANGNFAIFPART